MTARTFVKSCVFLVVLACTFLSYSLLGMKEKPFERIANSSLMDSSQPVLQGFKIGVPRTVNFTDALSASTDWLSPADYKNQLRDWLLYTVVAATTQNVDSLLSITADTSPLRRSYLSPTTRFQHSSVRSAYVGNGTVVVLLPREANNAFRRDMIAQAVDYHTMVQGTRAERVWLVEYWLLPEDTDPKEAVTSDDVIVTGFEYFAPPKHISATLTLRAEIPQTVLYSKEFGWVQTQINDLKDLEEFLASTDDLISSDASGSGVLLSGRDYQRRTYGQLTSEHIATLWQSREKQTDIERLDDQRQDRLIKRLMKWSVEQQFSDDTPEAEQFRELIFEIIDSGRVTLPLDAPPSARETIDKFVKQLQKNVQAEVETLWEAWSTCDWQELKLTANEFKRKRRRTPDEDRFLFYIEEFESYKSKYSEKEKSYLQDPGFSLDPSYDLKILSKKFDEYLEDGNPLIVDVLSTFERELRDSFKDGNSQLLECLLDTANKANNKEIAQEINRRLLDPASYQQARYDGMLAGTEVGQILFVTDLLAKLIDMDFDKVYSAYFPEGDVNWSPTVYSRISKTYALRMENFPSTRIWFGQRENAYNIDAQGGKISFGAIATRVFALSSGAFAQDRKTERQPNYLSGQFVDWFNQHYDRVAQAEPHYDRLNQLTKWSAVIYSPAFSELSFLSDVKVRRDLWFPDWIKTQSNRPFAKSWVDCFYERGKYRQDVETMFILHTGWSWSDTDGELIKPSSDRWCDGAQNEGFFDEIRRQWAVRGGVSLPGSSRLSKVGPYAPELSETSLLRRADIVDASKSQSGDTIKLTFAEEYGTRRTIEITTAPADSIARASRLIQSGERTAANAWEPRDATVYSRGRQTEIRQKDISEKIVGSPRNENLLIETALGDTPIARTTLNVSDQNLAVSQEILATGLAEGLSPRLTSLPQDEWVGFLSKQPSVKKVFETHDSRHFVQFRNDGSWVELRATTSPGIDIEKGVDLRASEPKTLIDHQIDELRRSGGDIPDFLLKNETKVILITPVTEDVIFSELTSTAHLQIRQLVADSGALSLEIRGPPGGKPPVPPGGMGFKMDGPDGPNLQMWFDRDTQNITVAKEVFREEAMRKNVFSFLETEKVSKLSTENPGLNLFIFKRKQEKDYVTIGDIANLNTDIAELENLRFGDNPQEFFNRAKSIHKDNLNLISRAAEHQQLQLYRQLLDRLPETTRLNRKEAFEVSASEFLSRNSEISDVLINGEALTQEGKYKEISALAGQAKAANDNLAARTISTEGKILAANVKVVQAGRKDINFASAKINGEPHFAAEIPPVIEAVDRVNVVDLSKDAVFIKSNIYQKGLQLDGGIDTLPPDLVALKLSNPVSVGNSPLNPANAEAIMLGKGGATFKRIETQGPVIAEPTTAAEYAKVLQAILDTSLIVAPPFGGGSGSGGSTSTDGPNTATETDQTTGIWVVAPCDAVEGYLELPVTGYEKEELCAEMTGNEPATNG